MKIQCSQPSFSLNILLIFNSNKADNITVGNILKTINTGLQLPMVLFDHRKGKARHGD